MELVERCPTRTGPHGEGQDAVGKRDRPGEAEPREGVAQWSRGKRMTVTPPARGEGDEARGAALAKILA